MKLIRSKESSISYCVVKCELSETNLNTSLQQGVLESVQPPIQLVHVIRTSTGKLLIFPSKGETRKTKHLTVFRRTSKFHRVVIVF